MEHQTADLQSTESEPCNRCGNCRCGRRDEREEMAAAVTLIDTPQEKLTPLQTQSTAL